MPTSFDEIYKRFLAKIADYEMFEYGEATLEEYLLDLLTASIDDFSELCKQDISTVDLSLSMFYVTLTQREKDILALGMVVHWIRPKVYNSDMLRNVLNTKDYSVYSPANLLEKMTDLLEKTETELDQKMKMYSYRNEDMASLITS